MTGSLLEYSLHFIFLTNRAIALVLLESRLAAIEIGNHCAALSIFEHCQLGVELGLDARHRVSGSCVVGCSFIGFAIGAEGFLVPGQSLPLMQQVSGIFDLLANLIEMVADLN